MIRKLPAVCVLVMASVAFAQTTQPIIDADPQAAIAVMRTELVDSFNKGDVDQLLSHLDPDVVITWQNGEVCRGPEQVKAYYNRMMTGPDRIVKTVQADPQVTDRHVYGDWAVSWGNMNDHFELTSGEKFSLGSKFTATIARRGEAWKVTSFHVSANLFDNEILGYAVSQSIKWSAIIAGVIGVIVGLILMAIIRRPKRAGA